jgi:dihydrofolate synthase/folylpolyglutamate synthase
VTGRQSEAAFAVIEARAEAVGASLVALGRDFDAWVEHGGVTFNTVAGGMERLIELPQPALPGAHQIDNMALAVAAMLSLNDPRIDAAAMARGVAGPRWPARLQRLTRGRYAEVVLAAGGELWLDGGHNPHAARALAQALAALHRREPRPLTLIVGLLANKDAEGWFAAMADLAPRILTVPVESGAGAAPETLAAVVDQLGLPAQAAINVDQAIEAALHGAQRPRVVICGSLYLAGEVLAADPRTWPD